MTQIFRSLKPPRTLLQSMFSPVADGKLICHLELWSTSNQVLELFGADVTSQFNPARATEIERLDDCMENWRHQWTDVLARKQELDDFTARNLDMYYHAAKLCLLALVFRGPSPNVSSTGADTRKLARGAIENALSFVKCIVASRDELAKLPSHFITMIAFASVFLLGVSSHTQSNDPIRNNDAVKYLQQLLNILNQPNTLLHQNHPLIVIKNGLNAAIGSRAGVMQVADDGNSETQAGVNFDFQLLPDDILGLASAQNIDWNAFPTDLEAGFPELWDTDVVNYEQ